MVQLCYLNIFMGHDMPHYQVYWFPFDQRGDGTLDTAYIKNSHKKTARIVWGYYADCLADVKEWETLIINAHSTEGSMYISSVEGDQGQRISVAELSSRIIQSKLPRNHVKIRILACQSVTFAQYLATTLGKGLNLDWYIKTKGGTTPNNDNSYQRIVVAGYKGKIHYDTSQRTLVPKKGSYWPVPNTSDSGEVVWYNSVGKATAKPPASTVEELEAEKKQHKTVM
jgi:hypothetical protein